MTDLPNNPWSNTRKPYTRVSASEVLEEKKQVLQHEYVDDETLLQQALDEIETNPRMTARGKMQAKAKLMREYRVIRGEPDLIRGHADQTTAKKAFVNSFARQAGRSIAKWFFGR
jgi:hypothetical protein